MLLKSEVRSMCQSFLQSTLPVGAERLYESEEKAQGVTKRGERRECR